MATQLDSQFTMARSVLPAHHRLEAFWIGIIDDRNNHGFVNLLEGFFRLGIKLPLVPRWPNEREQFLCLMAWLAGRERASLELARGLPYFNDILACRHRWFSDALEGQTWFLDTLELTHKDVCPPTHLGLMGNLAHLLGYLYTYTTNWGGSLDRPVHLITEHHFESEAYTIHVRDVFGLACNVWKILHLDSAESLLEAQQIDDLWDRLGSWFPRIFFKYFEEQHVVPFRLWPVLRHRGHDQFYLRYLAETYRRGTRFLEMQSLRPDQRSRSPTPLPPYPAAQPSPIRHDRRNNHDVENAAVNAEAGAHADAAAPNVVDANFQGEVEIQADDADVMDDNAGMLMDDGSDDASDAESAIPAELLSTIVYESSDAFSDVVFSDMSYEEDPVDARAYSDQHSEGDYGDSPSYVPSSPELPIASTSTAPLEASTPADPLLADRAQVNGFSAPASRFNASTSASYRVPKVEHPVPLMAEVFPDSACIHKLSLGTIKTE
ncbi:hypothetical protein HDU96_003983 [Phlyctochytrium bullatum]|nr:hypothetical protein HDU96_003983 [Phlyctochytrium bullatum]